MVRSTCRTSRATHSDCFIFDPSPKKAAVSLSLDGQESRVVADVICSYFSIGRTVSDRGLAVGQRGDYNAIAEGVEEL